MKIKNLGTLHSVSSGKMVDPLTQTYFQAVALRLNNCLLLEPKRCIVAPKLAIELFPLKFVMFFRMKMFSGKQRWTCKKQDLKPLIWHNVLKVEDWYLPTHILRRQDNLGKTYPIESFASSLSFSAWSAITLYTCTQQNCASYLNPRNLLSVLDQDMASHPYIKFHAVTTQTPLQNEVVFYHSGNGTLQNCHCFLAVWLASQCHGR